MPRKLTGRPRGRPPGTGILGAQTRLTVRIPAPLYDRLEAFAAGPHVHRGSPQLAQCVREALEEYRVLPTSRRESRFSLAYSHPYVRNLMTWRQACRSTPRCTRNTNWTN